VSGRDELFARTAIIAITVGVLVARLAGAASAA